MKKRLHREKIKWGEDIYRKETHTEKRLHGEGTIWGGDDMGR